nr:HlyD family efflux transporter periplasmic adaptor subunit [Propionicimonas sp.]
MTWENRLRLLGGVTAVVALVLGLTLVFNHRQNQITSYRAAVAADSYTVGADHAGTVVAQRVQAGDTVQKGQQLFAVQSLQLKQDLANGLEVADTEAYRVTEKTGTITYYSVIDGRVDKLEALQGNSVPGGSPLAEITGGDRYINASFRLVPRDYARVAVGAQAQIVLPNDQVVTGTVDQVSVSSDVDGAVSTLRIAAPVLQSLDQKTLAEPGTPVTVIVQLADTSWFAPVTDAVNDLLLQVGLR